MDPSKGGPCQGIRNFIPALAQLGVENEVVSLDSPSASFLEEDDFPIHALGPVLNPWSYSKVLTSWLLRHCVRYDVVVVHGLWLYPGYAVSRAISKAKKQGAKVPRFFVMPHGMLDPYFQKAPERRLKAVRNWFYWKLIEGKIVNGADGVLFTCEEELILAKQTFWPYKPKKAINVGYGISEPPKYSVKMKKDFSEKCAFIGDTPYLVFLSRIHSKKGLDILLTAYKSVSVDFPDLPKLVIAGPGIDSPYGKKLLNLVHADDVLQQRVLFTGMLTGDAKWGAFYGSEAFILPSHQENFGIAVVEAMACGKPVLISNKVNIWREIEKNEAGLVGEDNVEDIVKMLKMWASTSGDLKMTMGNQARKCFDEKFHIAVNTKRYLQAIQF